MSAKSILRVVVKPLIYAAAAIYFTIDALFLLIARPITRWLSKLAVLESVRRWVGSLSPYPALALLVIPWLALEPIKPLALYIMATGHFAWGVALLIAGELLKLVFLERLYDLNKAKLMSIPAFAWTFNLGQRILDWLQITRLWRFMGRSRERIGILVRHTLSRWRRYIAAHGSAHGHHTISREFQRREMRPARSLSRK